MLKLDRILIVLVLDVVNVLVDVIVIVVFRRVCLNILFMDNF